MFQELLKEWAFNRLATAKPRIGLSQFKLLNEFAAYLDRVVEQRDEAAKRDGAGESPKSLRTED